MSGSAQIGNINSHNTKPFIMDAGRILDDFRSGAITREQALTLLNKLPYEDIGFAKLDHHRQIRRGGIETVFCAGKTAEFFGANVIRCYDVGIAGIHRLFACLDEIRTANAVVAIAGMEGALGGVIAGLVSVPVVAVPTSVGYGASFAGIAPLLTMLNSCAEGMSVVNIDNGFGAGYLAARINSLVTQGNHP